MRRIDATDADEKWRYACPDPRRHRNWRVVDGLFECRACGETYDHLIDLETDEKVPREEIEIVGAHADYKGAFGRPTVE